MRTSCVLPKVTGTITQITNSIHITRLIPGFHTWQMWLNALPSHQYLRPNQYIFTHRKAYLLPSKGVERLFMQICDMFEFTPAYKSDLSKTLTLVPRIRYHILTQWLNKNRWCDLPFIIWTVNCLAGWYTTHLPDTTPLSPDIFGNSLLFLSHMYAGRNALYTYVYNVPESIFMPLCYPFHKVFNH